MPLNWAPRSFMSPGDVGVGGRSLEEHVLEQVGHAGLAVALVARADQDRQVDGDLGPRGVGEQEHAQAVVQPVLGDPLDRRDLLELFGRRFGAGSNSRSKPARQPTETEPMESNARET